MGMPVDGVWKLFFLPDCSLPMSYTYMPFSMLFPYTSLYDAMYVMYYIPYVLCDLLYDWSVIHMLEVEVPVTHLPLLYYIYGILALHPSVLGCLMCPYTAISIFLYVFLVYLFSYLRYLPSNSMPSSWSASSSTAVYLQFLPVPSLSPA